MISDAEWEVMRVLWARKARDLITTSRDVLLVLNRKKAWSASTVKTLLGRLVDKGLVKTTQKGRTYHYYPLVSQKQAIESQITRLLGKICQKEQVGLLDLLIAEVPMTSRMIKDLEEKLMAKSIVTEVTCNCCKGQCVCTDCTCSDCSCDDSCTCK